MNTTATLAGFEQPIHAVIQGASRGLGLAFVKQLLAKKNVRHVMATCRRPATADELQSLASQAPGRLTLVALDVTDEATIADAADQAAQRLGAVDLVINVAGVLHDERRGMMPEKKLDHIDPDHAIHAFRVNSLGPLLVIKHFASLLRGEHKTVVANLSARVGSIGDNHLGGWYSYRATKAAQNMFTRTVSREFKHHRHTANALCVALHPGTVDTGLSKPFQSNVPEGKLFSPSRGARQLLAVIGGLTADDTGQFFDWAGDPIPW